MSRTPVTVRAATPTDVASLRELWSDILRKGGLDEQLADVARVVATAREREDQCVAVAEVDGEVAGAVYLEAATFTPLNLEPAVLAVSPHSSRSEAASEGSAARTVTGVRLIDPPLPRAPTVAPCRPFTAPHPGDLIARRSDQATPR